MQRKCRQQFDSALGHTVILLQTNPGPQFVGIQSGLGGEDVADFEHVIPVGIQMRSLVREQSEAVSEMMTERIGLVLVEHCFCTCEQLAA